MSLQNQILLKTFLKDVSQKNKLNQALEKYVKDFTTDDNLKKIGEIPFSSARKYSACIYDDFTLVLGAPEILLKNSSPVLDTIKQFTEESLRVVVFGKILGRYQESDGDVKTKFIPLGVIAIEDPIRDEAAKTLEQLTKEDIGYRIISGDSADTVSAIAKKINPDYPASSITGEELDQLQGDQKEQAILNNNIFARIKPQQKQEIIRVFKKNKLFTIMIGDGANDVLALRESDLGIAMNGGSTMAKDVADVVLLNNSFATLPVMLSQGRRILTNIQTIANIYLMKNISAITSILMLGFIGLRFPFDPKHVELSSVLIIGLPSLILVFEKHNFHATDEGFVKRLLLFSGIVGFGNAIIYTSLYTFYDLTSDKLFYSRSIILSALIFSGINNLILIYLQHYNFREIIKRKILVTLLLAIIILFTICLIVPVIKQFFAIADFEILDLIISFSFCTVGAIVIGFVLKKFQLLHFTQINLRSTTKEQSK